MSVFPPDQCCGCRWLDRSLRTIPTPEPDDSESTDAVTYVCEAFPSGIPADILTEDFDHARPHEGDNGIRYESRRSGPASPPRAPLP